MTRKCLIGMGVAVLTIGLASPAAARQAPAPKAPPLIIEKQGSFFVGERDVWTYSLQDKKAAPLIEVPSSNQINPSFSPDGRWIAYGSNETGSFEIYVQRLDKRGDPWQDIWKHPQSIRQAGVNAG